jgi:hypothetical protein
VWWRAARLHNPHVPLHTPLIPLHKRCVPPILTLFSPFQIAETEHCTMLTLAGHKNHARLCLERWDYQGAARCACARSTFSDTREISGTRVA